MRGPPAGILSPIPPFPPPIVDFIAFDPPNDGAPVSWKGARICHLDNGEITLDQRKEAFVEVESDLADHILAQTAVPWTDTFREAEALASAHTSKNLVKLRSSGLRILDWQKRRIYASLCATAAPAHRIFLYV